MQRFRGRRLRKASNGPVITVEGLQVRRKEQEDSPPYSQGVGLGWLDQELPALLRKQVGLVELGEPLVLNALEVFLVVLHLEFEFEHSQTVSVPPLRCELRDKGGVEVHVLKLLLLLLTTIALLLVVKHIQVGVGLLLLSQARSNIE
uniref:Uncharacterized protein n=1 Tax=Strombidium rassoulzadegani TaxID=1082188 RepID=A0A7S3CUG9_9SPIT